ncbi:MAG TPA: flagellar basal body P-ring formation chaperone FlgA [Steroidobacteraceae bacterium]|jgi:flagella basal body P-ring formation protein FlgA|nr:flagellar basal body P-ring formation chaperone FlgA [Steroidobacteraceae bacterium]HNS28123.1 flagellar basal body P-ring formation chaperone FlgA [Steroidobacteraceae bacterium]
MRTRITRGLLRHARYAVLLAAVPLVAQAQAIEDPADIGAAASAFLRAQVPASPGVTTVIHAAHLDPRLRLPKCGVPLQATWAPGSQPAARTNVFVACPQGKPWRVNVPLTLRSRLDVLVLTAAAARGRTLAATDVATRNVEVDGLSHSYIRGPAEIAGKHLARPAPAGAPLQAAWFTADKLVKRGQQVTLVALADGIRIRAPGRALSDGAARERVRVQNLSSAKIVEGVVENATEVRVTP